eukprot:1920747-Rhodomonas_salina.4
MAVPEKVAAMSKSRGMDRMDMIAAKKKKKVNSATAYGPATRCPYAIPVAVLTLRMVLRTCDMLSGTDLAYAPAAAYFLATMALIRAFFYSYAGTNMGIATGMGVKSSLCEC